MAVDPVPWFVGGGAQHSPEVARLLAYAAFRGNEGVVGLGDLKVRALAVPGNKVRVMPGAASVLNRAAGMSYQAYAARITSEEQVSVAATGSGGGRADMVVLRVEDPYLPGEPWQDPADPTVGPYVFPRIISNVPSTARTVTQLGLGYSAIPLARINLPASTATITDAMITDLRVVANPRRERRVEVIFPTAATPINWQATMRTICSPANVPVPPWAVQAKLIVTLSGLILTTGNTNGSLCATIGDTVATPTTYFDENFASGAGNWSRTTYQVAGELAIPSAFRGTTQPIVAKGLRINGPGSLATDQGTTITVDVEWLEVAE